MIMPTMLNARMSSPVGAILAPDRFSNRRKRSLATLALSWEREREGEEKERENVPNS